MINIEVTDINGKSASINNTQIYNNILNCKIYSTFDKPWKQVTWNIENVITDYIITMDNSFMYKSEFRFYTKDIGEKKFTASVTFIDNTIETKELNLILIPLPN